MGSSDDWEAVFEARVAALPANEEKYSWYAKLPEIVAMSGSAGAGEAGVDPDLYENVKRALTGGEGSAAIAREYGARSKQISAAIANATRVSCRSPLQKAEMQSLTLDDLLSAAEAALPFYGELLQAIADDLAHPVEFLRCPTVKAKARASNKVTIKYGGDCRHVKDLVRGTFIFESLDSMYAGIEAIVTHPLLNGHAQCVVDFDDRWQAPLSGGYSDCQLLICIMGHLCELQVNVREMIVAKKGGGHVAYDVWRFVNEYLLFASIQNDVVGMRKLLASGLVTSAPDAIKDQNGFRSCHFLALRAEATAIRDFVDRGADVFSVSSSGDLPATTSATQRDWATTAMLLDLMETRVATDAAGASKFFRDEETRTALYQLFTVLFEAPDTSCGPGPPPAAVASVARLVARADAQGEPVPFVPFTYEDRVETVFDDDDNDVKDNDDNDDDEPAKASPAGRPTTVRVKVFHKRPRPPPPRGTLWHFLASRSLVGAASRLATANRALAPLLARPAAKLRAYAPTRRDAYGRSAVDIAASAAVDSPEMVRVLLGVEGCGLATLRYRHEAGPRVLAALDAGDLRAAKTASLTIRPSPAEERAAVLCWRDGVAWLPGAWELTFGARHFDGPETANGGRWPWDDFSDTAFYPGGSVPHVYFRDNRADNCARVVDGVVAALCAKAEKGALVVIVDPLAPSGAVAAYDLLPALFARVSPRSLIRVLFVVPTRASVADAAMDALWPYSTVLVGGQVDLVLRGGTDDYHPMRSEVVAATYAQVPGDADVDDLDSDHSATVRPQWDVARRERGRLALVSRAKYVAFGKHRSMLVAAVASQLHANHLWFDATDANAAELRWLLKQFDMHYSRRAYIWAVVGGGIEEGELAEGRDKCGLLLREVDAWERSAQMIDYGPDVPLPPRSAGAAPWWTVCVGAEAEALARNAGVAADEIRSAAPIDIDAFDAAEKRIVVFIIDSADYCGRDAETISTANKTRDIPLFAAVLVPDESPGTSPRVRQDWAALAHFTACMESLSTVVFLPRGDPNNVVALRGLDGASDLERLLYRMDPTFGLNRFFTTIPTGICAPRPHRNGREATDADGVARWRASVDSFFDKANLAAKHAMAPGTETAAEVEEGLLRVPDSVVTVEFDPSANPLTYRVRGEDPATSDGGDWWVAPELTDGERIEGRYPGDDALRPCTVLDSSALPAVVLEFDRDHPEVRGLDRFKRPFMLSPLLTLFEGDRRHRLGPEQMLPRSVDVVPRWLSSQHASAVIAGSEDREPHFITITSYKPCLDLLIKTMLKSFTAIVQDDAATDDLAARLNGHDLIRTEPYPEKERPDRCHRYRRRQRQVRRQ
ncbi:hypothetical protein SO694_00006316 [Aureococcus anophagefferens]|uniref:Uncharacterized protein n=1 Tax=Aureococcus anophagefferens TaxID=44056 RepID=A0ABR1GA70_AURAN